MERIHVPYSIGRNYIQEGDVLLFRGKGHVSSWIKWAGQGEYSHVAMASWRGKPKDSLLECVEFKEWRGGRVVNLSTQVKEFDGMIDVFRVSPKVITYQSRKDGKGLLIVPVNHRYDGLAATHVMRELTGLPYGWKRIWKLIKHFIPGLRLFIGHSFEDKSENGKLYPVCSTAVVAAIRRVYVDLVPNFSDFEVMPSHLARCRDLHYLFTLDKDIPNGQPI
jgi:hypothetical protein